MAAQKSTSADSSVDVSSPYTPRRPSPIISISINHPIGTALRKIKNFLTHKQTLFSTTFSIKVTPIVALVSLLGVFAVFGGGITTAYTIGKSVGQKFLATSLSPTPSSAPTPPASTVVTRTGTVKATYQLLNANGVVISPTGALTGDGSSSSSGVSAKPTPTPTPAILHYILVARNGSINYLAGGLCVHVGDYLNHRVLVTGIFDTNKNTLTVSKTSDIEILQ